MRHIHDIMGRMELVACVAIAACSPSVVGLPWKAKSPNEPAEPPTPADWAEHVVKHAEALRNTIRWAWAARVEEK